MTMYHRLAVGQIQLAYSMASQTRDPQALGRMSELRAAVESVGLPVDTWLPVLAQECGITNIRALQHSGRRDYEKAVRHSEQAWETVALQKLFRLEPEQEELRKALQARGLQADKWLPILEAKLGVRSAAALKHFGAEEYQVLARGQLPAWEKQALQVLCQGAGGIPSLPQEQLREERHGLAQGQAQTELSAGPEQGSGVWECPAWATPQLLESVSGGLVLQGLLLSQDGENLLRETERLLQPPEGCALRGPLLPESEEVETFYSAAQESLSKALIRKLGVTAGIGAFGGLKGLTFGAGIHGTWSNHNTWETESAGSTTYCCLRRQHVVPTACCELSPDELQLSPKALAALRELDANLQAQALPLARSARCWDFLERFGSHVATGLVHFGGIYWEKAEASDFARSTVDLVRNELLAALGASAGANFSSLGGAAASLDASRERGHAADEQHEARYSQTLTSVSKVGGSAEAASIQAWKAGLLARHSTWRVIDRGSCTHLVPVWQLVLKNHSRDIRDAETLARALKECWEEAYNMKRTPWLPGVAPMLITELQELVSSIAGDLTPGSPASTCLSLVVRCLGVRQQLRQHVWLDTDALWYRHFLCNAPAQALLAQASQRAWEEHAAPGDTLYLLTFLRDLLSPTFRIHPDDFPGICQVQHNLDQAAAALRGQEERDPLVEEFCMFALKPAVEAAVREWLAKQASRSMEEGAHAHCMLSSGPQGQAQALPSPEGPEESSPQPGLGASAESSRLAEVQQMVPVGLVMNFLPSLFYHIKKATRSIALRCAGGQISQAMEELRLALAGKIQLPKSPVLGVSRDPGAFLRDVFQCLPELEAELSKDCQQLGARAEGMRQLPWSEPEAERPRICSPEQPTIVFRRARSPCPIEFLQDVLKQFKVFTQLILRDTIVIALDLQTVLRAQARAPAPRRRDLPTASWSSALTSEDLEAALRQ
ncbi:hypothetical protein Y1Q_0017848 [Alligator mississippiensis]|uniref:Uncharacterized protein n=1 Tax=Alligator mississippiensis TaxID=8496 RepID=A0A151N7Q2_ALLMI|nr:hypothetical protein Y1Q_0017848 [Alligator mississippiensis]